MQWFTSIINLQFNLATKTNRKDSFKIMLCIKSVGFPGGAATAATKSLQSCPTLCDPMDCSLPGSSVPGFSRQEHWSGLPFPSPMHESEKWKWSRSVVSDPQWSHGLQPSRLLHPKEPTCQCKRHRRYGFSACAGNIPWRRAWQPTPVFLPGESHGQRSMAGYSPWGHRESDRTDVT